MTNPMADWLRNTFSADTTPDEDLQKNASHELFAKLASERGIDLNALPAEQVAALYHSVMGTEGEKVASPVQDSAALEQAKQAQLEKQAADHWREKRAQAEKLAEYEVGGRVMAHAYWTELNRLQKEASEGGFPFKKEEGDAPKASKSEKSDKETVKDEESEEKKASAFEALAQTTAIVMAQGAGYNEASIQKIAERVNAIGVLGLGESEKVASVTELEVAVQVRALEYLERAGLSVDWSKV